MKRRKSQPVLRRRDCRRRCSGAVHELECELGIYWGYSRMPPELLCRVISSLQSTIEEGFPYHNDRNILLAAAIICLTKLFLCLPQRVSTICCWEKFQQILPLDKNKRSEYLTCWSRKKESTQSGILPDLNKRKCHLGGIR
ncbi:uncharacterized protein LOC130987954 isoform X4 [Salvia miltiorrhiza]|uniref:uncharacterized protein LOC130987954 isoform X4 n=1 Tax=Salvia miltiorrhiza TaxID=226208 RepID=UPI0025AB921E|nr:uncharacterized protein LOC130987954 isoform X4 [Salvia miltiorrhiza]